MQQWHWKIGHCGCRWDQVDSRRNNHHEKSYSSPTQSSPKIRSPNLASSNSAHSYHQTICFKYYCIIRSQSHVNQIKAPLKVLGKCHLFATEWRPKHQGSHSRLLRCSKIFLTCESCTCSHQSHVVKTCYVYYYCTNHILSCVKQSPTESIRKVLLCGTERRVKCQLSCLLQLLKNQKPNFTSNFTSNPWLGSKPILPQTPAMPQKSPFTSNPCFETPVVNSFFLWVKMEEMRVTSLEKMSERQEVVIERDTFCDQIKGGETLTNEEMSVQCKY